MTIMEIPCYIVRGGTSKGVFIDESLLPAQGPERDRVILKLMGSPDIRQIDGLGGGDPLTSKVAIISPSREPGCEVDYLSGEVRLNQREVNYGIMCGNLASAVALVASDMGFISLPDLKGEVNIYNRNSGKRIRVNIEGGQGYSNGIEQKVKLTFKEPGGAVTGMLLPTGQVRDRIEFDAAELECSIVDAGTLYAYFRATSFGLRGDESPQLLDSNEGFKASIERLRNTVAEYVNERLARAAANDSNRGNGIHAGQVKVAIVSDPIQFSSEGSEQDGSAADNDCDIVARIINPVKTHKAFAISGAVCLGAAAALEATLVWEMSVPYRRGGGTTRIGHPGGVMEVGMQLGGEADSVRILAAEVHRTARILMKGTAFVSL